VAPQVVILVAGAAALGAYNQSVTGSPLTLPYKVHENQYGQTPLFHGQAPAERAYRHEVLERFHSGWSMDWYRNQSSLAGWLHTKLQMTWQAGMFFVPGLLAIPIIALLLRPQVWAAGYLRAPLVIGGLTFLISLACLWNYPHYLAPVAPLVLIAVVAGLRNLDVVGRLRLGPLPYAEALLVIQACVFLAAIIDRANAPRGGWHEQRAQTLADLEALPKKQLVLVRYSPQHNVHQEWVYNRADIDQSKVAWARSMDPANDQQLARYFADRDVWLLEPDTQQLRHYSSAASEGASQAPFAPLAPLAGASRQP
jgi:hypothetical protein